MQCETITIAEQFFKAAQKLAGDPNAPAELQAFGKVLQRIMLGDMKVDLSELPGPLADAVKKMLS